MSPNYKLFLVVYRSVTLSIVFLLNSLSYNSSTVFQQGVHLLRGGYCSQVPNLKFLYCSIRAFYFPDYIQPNTVLTNDFFQCFTLKCNIWAQENTAVCINLFQFLIKLNSINKVGWARGISFSLTIQGMFKYQSSLFEIVHAC